METKKSKSLWLRDKGITDIVISVVVGNEEALKFYEKFGFKPRKYILDDIALNER